MNEELFYQNFCYSAIVSDSISYCFSGHHPDRIISVVRKEFPVFAPVIRNIAPRFPDGDEKIRFVKINRADTRPVFFCRKCPGYRISS